MKTREEVEVLKEYWSTFPDWDIEDTEGFEEYRDELIEFRIKTKKEVDEEKRAEKDKIRADFLKRFNIKNTNDLIDCLIYLEDKIITLENKVFGI